MAHVLDLNLIEQPTLELRLCDEARTTIHVTIPDTDLVKEYQAKEKHMTALLSSGSHEGVDASYDLLASVISCNEEGLAITAEDLKKKYRINLFGLVKINKAYVNFIRDIEKN